MWINRIAWRVARPAGLVVGAVSFWGLSCVGVVVPAGGGVAGDGVADGAVLRLETGTLPVGRTGEPFAAELVASGGVPPYTFARTRGDDWPAGLTVDAATGIVSGVPGAGTGGAYFIDVAVTDGADPPVTHERRLTLVISEPGNEFGAIRSWILPTCAASACHSPESHVGGLILEPATAYGNVVGVAPENPAAVSAGLLLVDAGDPDSSFLYRKMTGDLGSGQGTRMPQAGVTLPDAQVALVRQWIEAGANPVPGEEGTGGVGPGSGGGAPSLEIGETVEQIYTPLADGDVLVIWFGTQGGVWVIPTVRATGLDTSVSIEATLIAAEGGEVLGATSFPAEMTPTLEGTEFQNVTLPIFNDFEVEGLFGTEAILRFDIVDDEGREATSEITVVLEPA